MSDGTDTSAHDTGSYLQQINTLRSLYVSQDSQWGIDFLTSSHLSHDDTQIAQTMHLTFVFEEKYMK